MVLSKALKAKLSSIPSGVASLSTLGLKKVIAKNCRRRRGPSFDHPLWQRSCARGARWRPLPSEWCCKCAHVWCVAWFVWGFRCSLSQWRKVGLPLVLWQESRQNFKGLPKVSGVATNHWVFLRCDWSPISIWFYYQSWVKKKGKMAFFLI